VFGILMPAPKPKSNGVGIPKDVKGKLFTSLFATNLSGRVLA
jgi:hypothetical protein